MVSTKGDQIPGSFSNQAGAMNGVDPGVQDLGSLGKGGGSWWTTASPLICSIGEPVRSRHLLRLEKHVRWFVASYFPVHIFTRPGAFRL